MTLRTRRFLAVLSLSSLAGFTALPAAAPAQAPAAPAQAPEAVAGAPPNVGVIMADDFGYGDIGPYGGWIDTPRLDRMAREGMRFLDFHSSGNVCSPTRVGLMTGRYQQRVGIPGVLFANPARPSHHDGMAAGELTLAEALGPRGYATGIYGKWHLGYRARFNPVRHGFDEFRGFVSGNIDYHSHVDTMGRADWWRDDEPSTEAGYVTHLVTKHALRFIERHRDRPFFLYLPHHAPHYPFQEPDDPADRAVGGEFDPRGSVADRRRAYRDVVREMDAGVGEVLDALKAHGIADRTLVWFFSDNGGAQWGSNGPLRGLKATDWEGGYRVPSIAVWPGRIPAGTESNQLASTLDVMPTLLSLVGTRAEPPPPGNAGAMTLPALHGVDPSPVLLRRGSSCGRRTAPSGTVRRCAAIPGSSSSTGTTGRRDPRCCSTSTTTWGSTRIWPQSIPVASRDWWRFWARGARRWGRLRDWWGSPLQVHSELRRHEPHGTPQKTSVGCDGGMRDNG